MADRGEDDPQVENNADDDEVIPTSAEAGSDNNNIKIFLRIKPSKKPSGFFSWDEDASLMKYNIPKDVASGLINNSRTNYKFRFDSVIGMEAKQDEVFDKVGKPCVENALNGFNSTVFAYGQTGSGKTFTITGGAERYEDRGLIPRALSMIYEEVKRDPNRQISVYVSYLEIYNNQGYDLLDQNHEKTKSLEDLPKVSMLEDEDGNCHLRNLSMHLVPSEEDALNLLFLGDTNRAVSETPMNLASSRSHCIFTVSMEIRRINSEVVLRSKLHLVDLAGSERAHKTGAKGQILKEATYINTSLHYLEMVIVALHEKTTKGRTHIPYRNSMMTSVLRDSLGGNCKTAMVATVSPDKEQTDESVSTCRFAQRVARVRNDARLNEDVDPAVIIRQLKAQVASLQEELALLKGDVKEGDELKDYEKDKLRQRCIDFVNDPTPEAHLNMGEFTYSRMKACFQILKSMANTAGASTTGSNTNSSVSKSRVLSFVGGEENQQRIAELEQLILQRDNEIAIMVNMIRKDNKGNMLPEELLQRHQFMGADEKKNQSNNNQETNHLYLKKPSNSPLIATSNPIESFSQNFKVDPLILEDPTKAFEAFKANYPKNDVIKENKILLKKKYDTAKELANVVNDARNQIKELTNTMEKIRKKQAIHDLSTNTTKTPTEEEEEEKKIKEKIDDYKLQYKKGFHELSELKKEIQHIQKMMEMARLKLQKDFDLWYQRQGKGNLLTETLLTAAQPKQEQQLQSLSRPQNSKQTWEEDSGSKKISKSSISSVSSSGSTSSNNNNNNSPAGVEEDISGFYEALDILKRRNSRKEIK